MTSVRGSTPMQPKNKTDHRSESKVSRERRSGDIAANSYIAFHRETPLSNGPSLLALLRNRQRHRRRNLVDLGKISLVERETDASPRIDVEKRVAHGHVHERFLVRDAEGFFVERDRHFVTEAVAELFEFLAGNVR